MLYTAKALIGLLILLCKMFSIIENIRFTNLIAIHFEGVCIHLIFHFGIKRKKVCIIMVTFQRG